MGDATLASQDENAAIISSFRPPSRNPGVGDVDSRERGKDEEGALQAIYVVMTWGRDPRLAG